MAGRLRKRADNRYTVTATLDGKRYFFYGKTQTEARAKGDEARARVKEGRPPGRPSSFRCDERTAPASRWAGARPSR